MKRRLFLSVFLLVPAVMFALNYGLFQQPIERVLERDDRNRGMEVRAHWRWYVDPTVLVYDLRGASADTTGVDLIRALMQFAYRQKDRHFGSVVLAWQGSPRFSLAGADFVDLGRRHPYLSPVDAMLVIPPMLRRPDGSRAFPEQGSLAWLQQHDQRLVAFNRFVNEWAGRKNEE